MSPLHWPSLYGHQLLERLEKAGCRLRTFKGRVIVEPVEGNPRRNILVFPINQNLRYVGSQVKRIAERAGISPEEWDKL